MSILRAYHIPVPGALLTLLAFFLPWLTVSCQGAEVAKRTGYDLANTSGNDFALLWAIPVVAVLSLVLVLVTMRSPENERKTAAGQILISLIGLGAILYLWYKNIPEPGETIYEYTIEYGSWLTIVGLSIIIVGGIASLLAARAGGYEYSGVSTEGVYQMPTTVPNSFASPGGGAAMSNATIGSGPMPDTSTAAPAQTYGDPFPASGPDPIGMGAPPRRATEVLQKVEPVDMAWLVIKDGPRAGHSFRLSETTTIGRDTGNDIILDDTSMSGQHAKVRFENGTTFTLTDLASTNGTFIFDNQKNDWEKIYRLELADGMQLKLGRTVLHFMTLAGQEASGGPQS